MDTILQNMQKAEWKYAPQDKVALEAMEKRLAECGREQSTINYADLVKGIEFRLSNVLGGKPFEINTRSWSSLDRAILGEFLGWISLCSYKVDKFMASSLAVSNQTQMPSDLFYQWMYEIGALSSENEETRMRFWEEQRGKAYAYYSHHQSVL